MLNTLFVGLITLTTGAGTSPMDERADPLGIEGDYVRPGAPCGADVPPCGLGMLRVRGMGFGHYALFVSNTTVNGHQCTAVFSGRAISGARPAKIRLLAATEEGPATCAVTLEVTQDDLIFSEQGARADCLELCGARATFDAAFSRAELIR